MTAYADRCPASKLVLSGYSEGANIVGDIVGGGDRPDCTLGIATGLDPSSGPGSKREFCFPSSLLLVLTELSQLAPSSCSVTQNMRATNPSTS